MCVAIGEPKVICKYSNYFALFLSKHILGRRKINDSPNERDENIHWQSLAICVININENYTNRRSIETSVLDFN